jgi:hypothetical protein
MGGAPVTTEADRPRRVRTFDWAGAPDPPKPGSEKGS